MGICYFEFQLGCIILTIGYFSLGQLLLLKSKGKTQKSKDVKTPETLRRFPQFWLFLLPGFFQIFLLKGTLWKHHYWERPLCPFFALAAALAILMIADLSSKIKPLMSKVAIIIASSIVIVSCSFGIHHYYSIHHFSSGRAKMYSDLNKRLTPDQILLSFEPLVVNQNKAKGEHYRPEVAWYLNRNIKQVTKFEDIVKLADTGKYPCYIMPAVYYDQQNSIYLKTLSQQLTRLYEFKFIATVANEPGLPYLVFDLTKKIPQKLQ